MEQVVIIGNGIAGISAATTIRKHSNIPIVVIGEESKYFYSRTALMYIYMGQMKEEHTQPYPNNYWSDHNIQLAHTVVTNIDTATTQVACSNGSSYNYTKLIIATGSKPVMPPWALHNITGVQGLYSLQHLQSMQLHTQNITQAVVVGGGLIGIEVAEMLLSRGIQVTYLIREASFWANVLPAQDANLLHHIITHHNVNLLLSTEVESLQSSTTGHVSSVTCTNGTVIPCQFVAVCVGVQPNIAVAINTNINTERGIIVNKKFETNLPNVYAIGDCAQMLVAPTGRRNIEQVWYTGKAHGEIAGLNIVEKPTSYNPSHWYNSAKLFTLEYSTYGVVPTHLPDTHSWLYWQHPTKHLALRLVWLTATGQFTGINGYGIRLRQDVCERWLTQKTSINEIIKNLQDANFNAEFETSFVKDVQHKYHNC